MANLLTKAGHEKLLAEHEQLSKTERPKVVQGIADAAAEGDRSENAEYIYGKKRLRELDKRLSYLAKLLKAPQVIDPKKQAGDVVQFGATVVIEDEDGVQKRWTIVGEGEADTKSGTISVNAPVAKALLGKRVGDLATINRPAGEMEVELLELSWG
jgi:transcription elongation factor GreB